MAIQNQTGEFSFDEDLFAGINIEDPSKYQDQNNDGDNLDVDNKDQDQSQDQNDENIIFEDGNEGQDKGGNQDNKEGSEEGDLSDEQLYAKNHFDFMKQQGYLNLPEDYEFDGDLYKAYQADYEHRQQQLTDSIIQNIPEEARAAIEYSLNGGSDVKQFVDILSGKEIINGINLEDETQVENFMIQHYRDKGIEEKYVKNIIEGMKDEDTLFDEASKIYTEKKQSIETQEKELLQQQKKQVEDARQKQQEYVSNLEQELQQAQWTPQGKEFIKKEIYEGRTVQKLQYILSADPSSFLQLARFVAAYDPETGFKNIVDKKEKSKATQQAMNDFFQKAASQRRSSSKGSKPNKNLASIPAGEFDIEF